MRPVPPRPDAVSVAVPFYPAERAIGVFLLVSAVSTVALRPPSWELLATIQLLGASAGLLLGRLRPPARRPARVARLLLPFVVLPWLYKLTGAINQGLDRWILDAPLERLEARLFGGQPSMFLAERAPWPLLSEFLHACYWAYLPLVPLLTIVLAAQKREREAEHTAGTIGVAFGLCYLFYIWLPVRSPLYNYPLLDAPLSDGVFFRLTHAFAARGGVVGGAFPSSHAALSTLVWLLAVRYERRVAWITAVPTLGLLVATVYGRYHYALDTIAGVLLGALVFVLDPVARLGDLRRRRATRGRA